MAVDVSVFVAHRAAQVTCPVTSGSAAKMLTSSSLHAAIALADHPTLPFGAHRLGQGKKNSPQLFKLR
jgi:hypothetical protein